MVFDNDSYLINHIKIALLLILVVILGGTFVYHFVFDFTLLNSLYMTIITIGTVGFSEVEPLTEGGKLFTSFIILVGIFIFAYAFSVLSAYIISININFNFISNKMEKEIKNLKGHTIICGYGRNGKQSSLRLNNYKQPFVVIDHNQEALEELEKQEGYFVKGNATDDDILIKAGIMNASHLISCLPKDTDNLFIVLTAKQLNRNITIVSRASEESSIKKLKIAGADNIIMPDKIGGDYMASLIVTPDLVEFLTRISVVSDNHMNIQEIVLADLPDIKTLEEIKIKERTGCTIIGLKKEDGTYIINPELGMPIDTNGRIIVLGNTEQINKLNNVFHIN
ncbi:MAG: potassium channel protein [Saprospiraceae bacterium]|nr:potassium channel protein [Saprospiraceae bacterium]